MSCPVPHTTREQFWLAAGLLGGALGAKLMMGSSTGKCPFYSGGSSKRIRPAGLKEFSVVYTDRALNHMSAEFQQVMLDIDAVLKETYNGKHVTIVPGSGSYAMEAVARQLGKGVNVLVIRNGYFSYRWSDIFQRSQVPKSENVLKATVGKDSDPQVSPRNLDEVLSIIQKEKPGVVFAPQVETSTGTILPNEYIRAVGKAVRSYGGYFVLDCIAAGCIWVDMEANNVDFVITAPQKGWSGPACAGIVVMSDRGHKRVQETDPDSLVVNLKMWDSVMKKYEDGGHKYYTTMPTDALRTARDMMQETKSKGLKKVKHAQQELGEKVRAQLAKRNFKSVAAPGFAAPGVVVVYTPPSLRGKNMGGEFKKVGVQIAAGVPWKLGEKEGTGPKCTFRLGLFGLDKLNDVDGTVSEIMGAVDKILASA